MRTPAQQQALRLVQLLGVEQLPVAWLARVVGQPERAAEEGAI